MHDRLPSLRDFLDGVVVRVGLAPAQLRFDLGPGPHEFTGRFGLLPAATSGDGCSDGVTFEIDTCDERFSLGMGTERKQGGIVPR